MSSVTIDMGDVDIYFDTIAEQVVSDCEEWDLLCELARQSERIGDLSEDATEKAFAFEAAARLRDLAKWFKENQP